MNLSKGGRKAALFLWIAQCSSGIPSVSAPKNPTFQMPYDGYTSNARGFANDERNPQNMDKLPEDRTQNMG